ncbi:TMEM175 family protein [Methyloceanibacter sp.]|uniref:TMEM175 family protein n=1 Tax=Methyloceanibacter sp. TaxID=1965321 RepID=UPI003D6D65BF
MLRGRATRGASLSKSIKTEAFIPRSRLEALTDGVFAFAMTLLVVNIELPEGFEPKSNQEFLARLAGLSDTFIAYLITFFVLVSFWFGRARETGEPEMASAAYAWAVLLHLLSVTFLPFSMLAVGRYDVPASIWIYGANMILLSLSAIAISRIAERDSGRSRVPSGIVELGVLIVSAVLSMATSLFAPDYAMLLYLLNLASPLVARAVYRR